MYQKWMEQLSKCILFHGIESDDLIAMLNCLNPKICNYSKNESISIQGDKFNGIGVILEGEAAVIKESITGDRMIMTILRPGEMFGEMAAYTKIGTWPATVTSQSDSTVMFMPPEKIIGECEKLCVSHRLLTTNMLRTVSEKAILLNRKVEYLTIKSIRGKICTFLLEEYKKSGKSTFMIQLKRNEMADFLNVPRPSLSREMCRMRDEGIIEFHRESIKIIDMNKLKSMAQ